MSIVLPASLEDLYADEPFPFVAAVLSQASPSSESSIAIFRFVLACDTDHSHQ